MASDPTVWNRVDERSPNVRRIGSMAAMVFALALFAAGAGEAAPADERAAPAAHQQAERLWQQGTFLHMMGQYPAAVQLFRRSIEVHPTAEGHTYLGWSLSMLGRLEEAIAECRKAIPLDRDFGNPYNDIGVYLITLGRSEEAMPWLEKATRARRYCCYQFPHFNMGRVYLERGRLVEAKQAFERALSYDPEYLPARRGLAIIKEMGLEAL